MATVTPIIIEAKSDAEGKLRIEIPVGLAGVSYTVKVVATPRTHPGWPAGYFESFGKLDDETFVAPPDPPEPPIHIDFT